MSKIHTGILMAPMKPTAFFGEPFKWERIGLPSVFSFTSS